MQGYADAFRSPSVQDAIMSAGQVQVAMVVWADGEMSSQVLPFQDVSNRRAAEDFAQRIDTLTSADAIYRHGITNVHESPKAP